MVRGVGIRLALKYQDSLLCIGNVRTAFLGIVETPIVEIVVHRKGWKVLKSILLLIALTLGVSSAAETWILRQGVTLVFFEQDNCGPCVALKRKLTEMGLLERVVFYNKKDEGVPALAKDLGVEWYPTVIVKEDKTGKKVGEFGSAVSVEQLVKLLGLSKK